MNVLAQLDASDPRLTGIVRFVPKLLAFVAAIAVGYLIARLLERLVTGLLERPAMVRVLERGGVREALARADIEVTRLLSRLVFYGVMLLVLQLAFGFFGPNPVSDLLARAIAFVPRIVVALVLIVVAAVVASTVRDIIVALIGGLSYGRALAGGAQIAIVGIGVFAALDQLAIAPTIVTGLFYAVLATLVGVTIVAVGGGGIAPMRQRWERALTRIADEAPQVRDEARRQREAQQEARRQHEAEEEARRQREAEEEARRQHEAEEEARRQREADEEARRQRQAEQDAERERRRQQEAELQAQREKEAQEEARRRHEEEQEARRQHEAEEEARRQREADEEADRKREAREQARRQEAETVDLVIRSTPPDERTDMGPEPAAASDESEDETLAFDPEPTTQIRRPADDDTAQPTSDVPARDSDQTDED